MPIGPIGIEEIYERECRRIFAMRRVLCLLNIYTLANIKDSLDGITIIRLSESLFSSQVIRGIT